MAEVAEVEIHTDQVNVESKRIYFNLRQSQKLLREQMLPELKETMEKHIAAISPGA